MENNGNLEAFISENSSNEVRAKNIKNFISYIETNFLL